MSFSLPKLNYFQSALIRIYYRMVLTQNKRSNVAKTAVARELACFIWGMRTGNVYSRNSPPERLLLKA